MSKYGQTFTDSTEHTAYSLVITSENGEKFIAELDDLDVQELMEWLERL